MAIDYEVTAANANCPELDVFRASVRRQLGYDPFRPGADRRVAVQIARKDVGFGGRIRWSDVDGRWVGDRRLSSPRSDCQGIAASLAFSVAVQIQLMAALAPAAPEPITAPSAPIATEAVKIPEGPASPAGQRGLEPQPTAAEETQVPTTPVTSPRLRPLRLSVGLGPSIAVGVSPETTGLGRLFANARVGRLSLELGADAALPVTRREAGTAGFSVDRFAAGAAACGHGGIFAACITGTLGRLQAAGFGVDVRASPAVYFSQVGARVMATHTVGDRFFAGARVEGLIMTSPSTVTLNTTPVWTTPRMGALFGMDLGATFF